MTPSDLQEEMLRLSKLIDTGVQSLYDSAKELATAENEYRKAKPQAWLTVDSDLLAAHRQAEVDARTADLRMKRDIAEGMRQAALEALRSRRTQLSALQTIANAYKAEADFDRTSPRETT